MHSFRNRIILFPENEEFFNILKFSQIKSDLLEVKQNLYTA